MDLAQIETGFSVAGIPAQLANKLLAEYAEAKKRYHLGDHRPTQVEGGRFAEAALRILEHALFGVSTPVGTTLPNFNAARLAKFESATSPFESLRIHVPRALFSIYAIRNKRDAAHLADGISANLQDATYVVGVLDWVLAEFVRIYHQVTPDVAQAIIDNLVKREVPVIEEIDGQPVCLKKLGPSDRILVFLYRAGTEKGLEIPELQQQMMHPHRGNLTKAVRALAARNLLLIHPATGKVHITSLGLKHVEAYGLLEVE